ncbi:sigma-54-dependent transcriptional regulator [Candidatus Latescibacterota bacterium]
MKVTILIVDDEKNQREMLGRYLKRKDNEVLMASSGAEALDIIKTNMVEIVITDQKMPKMSGLELAAEISDNHPNISTIIVTAYGSIQDAVSAMKKNVEDYLTKPINLEELDIILNRILEKRQLIRENEMLKEKIRKATHFPDIIYKSEAMEEVLSIASRVSRSHATVLITGESGTGKELVARAVHESSDRMNKPFIAVNCSAVPENLIESKLFGHEKGAFTGADKRRTGSFEQADGGTLFIDEIGEIPLNVQVKLLRVLQERKLERVGSNESIPVDVRILAATNRDLEKEIRNGSFREDLYYRVNVVRIEIPPLRKRKADIPILSEHFLKLYAREHNKNVHALTREVLDILVKYSFPGNVRELSNMIEQAVVLTREETISQIDLSISVSKDVDDKGEEPMNLEDKLKKIEKKSLWSALRETKGNKSAAARLLGISEHKVRYLIKKYGEEAN